MQCGLTAQYGPCVCPKPAGAGGGAPGGAAGAGQPSSPATVETRHVVEREVLNWAPLVRPWSRIFFDPGCEDEYGQLAVTGAPLWRPDAWTTVRFYVRHQDIIESIGDNSEEESARDLLGSIRLSLDAEVGQRVVRDVVTFTHAYGSTCAERQALTVYVGERIDGRILVSMETLPQRNRMRMPGRTRRAILGWGNEGIEILATWEGETSRVPQLFRMRPP